MDTTQLITAMVAIMAASVGIVEALKRLPRFQSDWAALTSIIIGVALGIAYLMTPAIYQPSFLVILGGATGTGLYGVARKIGGDGATSGGS